jgi:hypothetical protein
MKKMIIILSAVFIAILVIIGVLLYLRGDEDTWICANGAWIMHGHPSAPMPEGPCGTINPVSNDADSSGQAEPVPATDNNPELIGGQKDEHGCLPAAGYSWCEQKQKCLRAWEESCP